MENVIVVLILVFKMIMKNVGNANNKTFDFVKCGKNEEVPHFRNIPHIKLN